MTDPIHPSLPSYMPNLATPASSYKTRQSSFQQTALQAQETQITLVTNEGDIVTLSRSTAQSNSISATQSITSTGNGQHYTIASLKADSLSIGIQGDLNEEELTDIKNLVDDLVSIASNFFSGKANASDTVLAGAMALSDMGSVSQLSASFSYTAAISNQLTAHPVPAFNPETASLIEQEHELAALERSSTLQYGDILRAQWEQITEFLDHAHEARSEQVDQQTQLAKTDTDTTQKMLDRIKKTMIKHPRTSPFSLALAEKAIEKAAKLPPGQMQSDMVHMRNKLQTSLFKEFTDWMLPA